MLDFARRTNEFVHINHRLTACANAGSAIRVCTSTTQKFNVILGQVVDSFARIPLNGGGSISCPGMLDCAEVGSAVFALPSPYIYIIGDFAGFVKGFF